MEYGIQRFVYIMEYRSWYTLENTKVSTYYGKQMLVYMEYRSWYTL